MRSVDPKHNENPKKERKEESTFANEARIIRRIAEELEGTFLENQRKKLGSLSDRTEVELNLNKRGKSIKVSRLMDARRRSEVRLAA